MRLDVCKPIHSTETKGRTPPWHRLYGNEGGNLSVRCRYLKAYEEGSGRQTAAACHFFFYGFFFFFTEHFFVLLCNKIFFCFRIQYNKHKKQYYSLEKKKRKNILWLLFVCSILWIHTGEPPSNVPLCLCGLYINKTQMFFCEKGGGEEKYVLLRLV